MVMRLVVAFVCLGMATCSDVVREEDANTNGVTPGLGEVQTEGAPGASLIGTAKQSGSPWEGLSELDPKWNQQLLQDRHEEMVKKKRDELKRAILFQKAALETQEAKESEVSHSVDTFLKEEIDTPEVEIEDGYKLNEVDFVSPVPGAETSSAEDMMQHDLPPPPELVKRSPDAQPVAPTRDALRPVVVVDAALPGETVPLPEIIHPDEATAMPAAEFQHWNLARDSDISPSIDPNLTFEAEDNTRGADVESIAALKARNILTDYFSADEVENKEGGLDTTAAWGVMNSRPLAAQVSGPETSEEEINMEEITPSTTPIPSPSASPLPREIYTNQPSITRKEIGDLSFANLLHISHSTIMKDTADEEELPMEVLQPTDSSVYRAFTGLLPHPAIYEPVEFAADMKGMGMERTTLIPDMPGQAAQTGITNHKHKMKSHH